MTGGAGGPAGNGPATPGPAERSGSAEPRRAGPGPAAPAAPGQRSEPRRALVPADASLQEVPVPGAGRRAGAPVEAAAVAEQGVRGQAAVPAPQGSVPEIQVQEVRALRAGLAPKNPRDELQIAFKPHSRGDSREGITGVCVVSLPR